MDILFRGGNGFRMVKVEAAEIEKFCYSFCFSFDLFCMLSEGRQSSIVLHHT